MIRLARLAAHARREDGGILLLFGLMLPAILLLTALALEIGNWYEHRRHLQLQTDAGALAAGQLFRECANGNDPAALNASVLSAMTTLAAQYGGDKQTLAALSPGTSALNAQVGSNGPAAGNVRAFSYQGAAYPPDYATAADTGPCTSAVFDIRATEDDIPHIFKNSPLATVHAHSRVEMKAINQLKGLLPLAVPDVRPNYVFATFRNETAGTDIATIELVKGSISNNQQTWIPKDPVAVTVPAGDIGVRLRLVGGTDPNSPCGTLYTECYDASSSNGIVHIRGWDSTTAAPAVHDAWILSGACAPDAYFASDDCSAGLQADVNLGATNPVTASTTVWATVDGGSTKYQLSPANTGTGVIRWTLSSGIPLTGPGPHPIDLGWNPGSGRDRSLGTVQRAYVASPDSGPIEFAEVYEQLPDGSTSSLANSFKAGETHTLGVTIKTIGNLLLSQPTDPPIYLRLFNDTGSASQNQSINCDRDLSNMEDELHYGCSPYYIKNPSLVCPGGNANNLWDIWYVNGQPLPCALVKTGASVGQISNGLNERIYGVKNPGAGACASSPVNWIRNKGFDGDAHPDDKRAMPLIVTPLGTFGGTGGDQVPVIDFGYFYVTGYKGDPCQGVDPNQDPVPNNRGSYVRGHFVKFFPLDGVVASDDKCDLTSITPCVSVLTR